MKHGHFQAASAHFLSVGLDAENKPVAWKHTKAGSFHNLSTIESEKLRDAAWYRGYSWGVYDFPYAVPAIETGYVPVDCRSCTDPGERSLRPRVFSLANRSSMKSRINAAP